MKKQTSHALSNPPPHALVSPRLGKSSREEDILYWTGARARRESLA